MDEISQEQMKNARTSGEYSKIWQTRGKCVFCDLKDKYILLEENGIVLTISLYPYIDGQIMAIPRQHITSPKQLTNRQWETIRKFNYISKKMIRKVHGIKSMWTLVREGGTDAQMTVSDHLHVHYIPFDGQDLAKWNYRELENTPLENVSLYRKHAKNFQKYLTKYQTKYESSDRLPIVVDLAITDKKGNILLLKRKPEHRINDYELCLPGGHVDDANNGLIAALKKELAEEIGWNEFAESEIRLLASQISSITFANYSNSMNRQLPRQESFIWNVYGLNGFDRSTKLSPGDDAAELIWMPISQACENENISPQLRKLILGLKKK